MKPTLFRPVASTDIAEAFRWYDEQRPGLGDEFLSELGATLERVEAAPLSYALAHRDTRRAFLRRFPYGLYYRLVDDRIVVVACLHARRDPRGWKARR